MMGSPGRMPPSTSASEDNNNKMLASPHSAATASAAAATARTSSPKLWRPSSSSINSSASGSAASPSGGPCPPGGLMVPVPVRAMPGQGLCQTPPPQLQRPDAANLLQPRDLPPHLGGVASTSSLAAPTTVPAMIATWTCRTLVVNHALRKQLTFAHLLTTKLYHSQTLKNINASSITKLWENFDWLVSLQPSQHGILQVYRQCLFIHSVCFSLTFVLCLQVKIDTFPAQDLIVAYRARIMPKIYKCKKHISMTKWIKVQGTYSLLDWRKQGKNLCFKP